MPVDLVALATELTTDPRGYGYAPYVASRADGTLAVMLNQPRPTGPTISIKRPDCTPAEVLEAIDIRDLPASPQGVTSVPLAAAWLESVTQFPTLRLLTDAGQKTLIRKNIDRLVGDTNGSQARLDAVAVRVGSRAEELFGYGVVVEHTQVTAALAAQRG